ncbi:MAG: hypothetical protein ACI4UJ_05540 [Candidatus Cryptobacteroides sp.]
MNILKKLTLLNLLAAAVLSCTGIELSPQPIEDASVPVEVVFSIPADGPGTKSSYRALGSSVDDVNLWIVSDGDIIHHSYLDGKTTMALVLSAGRSYSFYALANISSDLSGSISGVSDLKSMRVRLQDLDLSSSGGSLPMAGTLAGVTLSAGATPVVIPMERLFSKVSFRFSPDADLKDNSVTITSVLVKNAASDMTPFSEGSYASVCADGDYSTATDLQTLASGGQVDFYCMENCCGKTTNMDPWAKLPESAPQGKPTYLEVRASVDGFQMSGEIIYRFCIGANNTNDYNLVRNTSYTVTLKSVCSSVDGSDGIWKIDSGDVVISEGKAVRLYVGQFQKMKLSEGDEVYYYDALRNVWVNFVNYSDDDYYCQTLRNGMCMTTYYSEENGSSSNPEFYFYSTARLEEVNEKVKIVHGDGTTELYTVRPPVVPTGFDDLSEVEVLDDGWTDHILSIGICGPLGTVTASGFRIPEGYLYADFPLSTDSYTPGEMLPLSEATLPAHLLQLWKENTERPSLITAELRESKRWSLLRYLMLEDGDGTGLGESLSTVTGGSAGLYLDCLNNAADAKLCFYGMHTMERRNVTLTNRLFSQAASVTVTTSFPSQGDLGECWNYELAPNSLKSNVGCSLPSGISSKASFAIEGNDSYIGIVSGKVRFSFPTGGTPTMMPAGGHYEITGSLTNPFTGEVKTGEYSTDVILYLPLISTVRVVSSSGASSVVGATAAVAATPAFHADNPVFEDLYAKIFSPTLGYRAAFSFGGTNQQYLYPSGGQNDSEQVTFTISGGVNVTNYTLQWLADYGAVHLAGFVDNLGQPYSEVNMYPSYSQEMKNKLSKMGDPVYAKLVLFSEVNTDVTPAYDYYSEGKYLYQLIWGQKWQ